MDGVTEARHNTDPVFALPCGADSADRRRSAPALLPAPGEMIEWPGQQRDGGSGQVHDRVTARRAAYSAKRHGAEAHPNVAADPEG